MLSKRAVFVGFGILTPLAGFVMMLGAMTSCGTESGGTAPTNTGPTQKSAAPAICPQQTTETTIDGSAWCCTNDHCESKGSPTYNSPCTNAGEKRVGTTYDFKQSSCGQATFKSMEQWLSVEYECRSEDGIAPKWEYVEPTSHCSRKLVRECASSETAPNVVTTSGENQAGVLCK